MDDRRLRAWVKGFDESTHRNLPANFDSMPLSDATRALCAAMQKEREFHETVLHPAMKRIDVQREPGWFDALCLYDLRLSPEYVETLDRRTFVALLKRRAFDLEASRRPQPSPNQQPAPISDEHSEILIKARALGKDLESVARALGVSRTTWAQFKAQNWIGSTYQKKGAISRAKKTEIEASIKAKTDF